MGGHVVCIRNLYNILVEKPDGTRLLEKPGKRTILEWIKETV
jgi:hypothetical protein